MAATKRKVAAVAVARAVRAKKPQRKRRQSATQPIDATKMYSFRQVQDLFGIGRWAILKLEDAGMPTGTAGGQKFVRGADLQDAIAANRK